MIEVKATAVVYKLDASKMKRDMRDSVLMLAKEAAQKFAAVALSRIPIRTGFVAGAFGPLMELLGSKGRLNPRVAFAKRALKTKAKTGPKPKPETYKGVVKTPTSGRQFATPVDQIFQWKGNELFFKFTVNISYFRINESVPGHAPTAPWQAIAAARAAYEEYMKVNMPKIHVRFEQYLIKSTIKS